MNRLAQEASKTAAHVLRICIRALDYCPPVDITFGEYLRALITADRDLVPDDKLSYRAAFIQAFRRRGIYPQYVRTLSAESLCWDRPEIELDLNAVLRRMSFRWNLSANRKDAFYSSKRNAVIFHNWIKKNLPESAAQALGLYLSEESTLMVNGVSGKLTRFEVHSVRPARRISPDGQQRLDVVVEITQSWLPNGRGQKYRGGCTLIIDFETRSIRYCIRKRVAHADRIAAQESFQLDMAGSSIRSNYFDIMVNGREPFAVVHRGA